MERNKTTAENLNNLVTFPTSVLNCCWIHLHIIFTEKYPFMTFIDARNT